MWALWSRLDSRVYASFLVGWICLSCFPGSVLCAVVTLDSMTIFNAHEVLLSPVVYFHCKQENKTVLLDVKKINVLYTFKGLESWQPLTEFTTEKCKRCGFYESDTLKSDDVYEEWEFCPSDFVSPEGKYTRNKKDEFNATFSCPECLSLGNADEGSRPSGNAKRSNIGVSAAIIIISIIAATLLIVGLVRGVKLWQKRKRQQEQARFLKLFEDGDDIEDELGLGTMV